MATPVIRVGVIRLRSYQTVRGFPGQPLSLVYPQPETAFVPSA